MSLNTLFSDAENYKEIADALDINLYAQYRPCEVIKKLDISRSTLDRLKGQGLIGYIKTSAHGMPRYWGWQLCEYLVRRTVCPGENPSQDTRSENGFLPNEEAFGTGVATTAEHVRQSEYHSALAIFKRHSND